MRQPPIQHPIFPSHGLPPTAVRRIVVLLLQGCHNRNSPCIAFTFTYDPSIPWLTVHSLITTDCTGTKTVHYSTSLLTVCCPGVTQLQLYLLSSNFHYHAILNRAMCYCATYNTVSHPLVLTEHCIIGCWHCALLHSAIPLCVPPNRAMCSCAIPLRAIPPYPSILHILPYCTMCSCALPHSAVNQQVLHCSAACYRAYSTVPYNLVSHSTVQCATVPSQWRTKSTVPTATTTGTLQFFPNYSHPPFYPQKMFHGNLFTHTLRGMLGFIPWMVPWMYLLDPQIFGLL